MQDPTEAAADDSDESQVFHLRTVSRSTESNTIVLQNENGPCALVAIANTLALQDAPTGAFIRESGQKENRIGEEALKSHLAKLAGSRTDNVELLTGLAEFLPKLTQGLDVNPKFDGTFDDTPELRVFASFGLPIVHGWVLGSIEREELGIADPNLCHISYEEFCEIQFSDTPNEKLGAFVQLYQSQLTTSGFMQLVETVADGKLAVLFWNNHFSTLLNHGGQLLILATDLGYQNKPEIVWEVLEPSGAGQYLNGDFEPSDQQISKDAELAKQLQREDNAGSSTAGTTSNRAIDSRRDITKTPRNRNSAAPSNSSGDGRYSSSSATPRSKSAGAASAAKKKKESNKNKCTLM